MITLPAGFDGAQLIADFFALAAPYIGVSFLIACGFVIINFLRTVDFS